MEDIMFFGCIDGRGHYLWGNNFNRIEHAKNPWGYAIDGTLQPRGGAEGVCTLNHKEGWIALSFWDYSVDTRPKSNGSFLARGDFSFVMMVQIAKTHFPTVVTRFNFKLVPWGWRGTGE